MSKIGIGIISVERPEFFEKCISTIPNSDCVIEVINGELNYSHGIDSVFYSKTKNNVAYNKNIALRHLIESEKCDHVFLCEDDIWFSDKDVCKKYIDASEKTGIQHFNYGGHGFYNKNFKTNEITPKTTIDYKDIKIDLYHNVLGAFSYYSADCIKKVGYMNTEFNNAMEHVDHTYRIIKEHLHPPFWWFADINDSFNYIHDIKQDHEGSVIRKSSDWQENFRNACFLFDKIHGDFPTSIARTNKDDLITNLKEIYKWKR